MIIQEGLSLDDLLLIPKFSSVLSRKDVDISNNLGKFRLELPIISSPMSSVTENEMCNTISKIGGLGIIHRFCSIEKQYEIAKKIDGFYGAAVGVTGDFFERYEAMVEANASIICIDIACGHHILMKKAIERINNSKYRKNIHLMVGNVATGDGFVWLSKQNVDSIRVRYWRW